MGQNISMRELQKLSAADLRAMTGARPVKCGNEVVAILTPVRPRTRKEVEEVSRRLDEIHAGFTPEDRAAIDAFLKDRGAEP